MTANDLKDMIPSAKSHRHNVRKESAYLMKRKGIAPVTRGLLYDPERVHPAESELGVDENASCRILR